VHAGEEDHARPGWTTSRYGQDCPWKSQSEWQTTEINGESTSMVWLTLGLRTAREQNRTAYYMVPWAPVGIWAPPNTWFVGPHESTQWQHVNRCSHLTQLMLVTDRHRQCYMFNSALHLMLCTALQRASDVLVPWRVTEWWNSSVASSW